MINVVTGDCSSRTARNGAVPLSAVLRGVTVGGARLLWSRLVLHDAGAELVSQPISVDGVVICVVVETAYGKRKNDKPALKGNLK